MRTIAVGMLALLGCATLGGCAYGPRYGSPAPGWAGESWARHVRRCERNFPRYDPRTDRIYRPGGDYRCPL